MKITLFIDDHVVKNAREAVRKRGQTLDQVIQDYIEQLGGESITAQSNPEQHWKEFEARCLHTKGRLNGWNFDRDEGNERRS